MEGLSWKKRKSFQNFDYMFNLSLHRYISKIEFFQLKFIYLKNEQLCIKENSILFCVESTNVPFIAVKHKMIQMFGKL